MPAAARRQSGGLLLAVGACRPIASDHPLGLSGLGSWNQQAAGRTGSRASRRQRPCQPSPARSTPCWSRQHEGGTSMPAAARRQSGGLLLAVGACRPIASDHPLGLSGLGSWNQQAAVAERLRRVGGYPLILQVGNACWSLIAPAVVPEGGYFAVQAIIQNAKNHPRKMDMSIQTIPLRREPNRRSMVKPRVPPSTHKPNASQRPSTPLSGSKTKYAFRSSPHDNASKLTKNSIPRKVN